LPGGPGTPPDGGDLALNAWNLMGGEINWSALDFICELLGITDVERLIVQLTTIRDRPK